MIIDEDINLLSRRKKPGIDEKKTAEIIRVIAIICLFLVAVSSLALFFLKITFSLSTLKKEERVAISNLSYYNNKIVKLFLIKNRAKNVSSILNKRPKYYTTVNDVVKQFPSEVDLSSVNFEKGKILVGGSSYSLSAMEQLFNNLVAAKINNQKVKKVILNGISVNIKDGKYTFSLILELT